MAALTLANVKASIGQVVAGGTAGTDPRVVGRINDAMQALMTDVPQGIFVGGVIQAIVTVNPTVPGVSAATFTLPPGMDVAFVFQPIGTPTPMEGWFNITNSSTFLDPDDIVDTVLVDLGFTGTNGQRQYAVPELPVGITQAAVSGLRAFTPVAVDTDVLMVQNVRAVKRMVLALEKSERYNDPATGETLRQEAVRFLVSELDRALTDPLRVGQRLAEWRLDDQNFAAGTLGNTYAKIALDMQGGQRIGRFRIQRLVYRALSWIFQRIYEYQLIERNRVKQGVPTLAQVPTGAAAAINPPIQFEIIRQVVQALIAEDNQGLSDSDRGGVSGTGKLTPGASLEVASKLFSEANTTLMRMLDAQLQELRHDLYTTQYNAATLNSLQWYSGKYGLEAPTGLKYSDAELGRLVVRAAQWLYQKQYEYELADRNRVKSGVPTLSTIPAGTTTAFSDPIPWEEMKLVIDSFVAEGDPVNPTGGTPPVDPEKLQANALALQRKRLDNALENLRHTTYAAALQSFITAGQFNTLGYFTAKLGLEMPEGLRLSDVELQRLINEAARDALQQRNYLGRTERYSNLPGHEEVAFVYALAATDVVSYPDIEILRRLVDAQLTPDAETRRTMRADAFNLVERNLQKQIEAKRNDVWHCLIRNSPAPQFGGVRAQIGLEWSGEAGDEGYKLSDGYASRITRQAWAAVTDHYNFLSREEDYAEPVMLAPPPVPADTAQIPFPLEIIKCYAEAQLAQDRNQTDRAAALKGQGEALIDRNLRQQIEQARYIVCITQQDTDEDTLGYTAGRLGLELTGPNGESIGLTMSDAKRKRLSNEAEQYLADSGRWKFMEGEYFLAVSTSGGVVLPADVETIIYAEWCGERLELKSRKWLYGGWAVRCGNGAWEGWGFNARLPLLYAGRDGDGNANYHLGSGCSYHTSPTTRTIRALCRRKWVQKKTDADIMLVQSYPAIKRMVESILSTDIATKSMHANGALKVLDNQLGVEIEGQTPLITVNLPGMPRGGGCRTYRRRW